MKLNKLIIIFLCCFILQGCKKVDEIVAQIANLTTAINDRSKDWQELAEKLPVEIRKAIKEDLANLAATTVAEVSGETRCNIDFLKDKITRSLNRWLDSHFQIFGYIIFGFNKLPKEKPHLCNVVPTFIDKSKSPTEQPLLQLWGYHLERDSIEARIQCYDNTEIPISSDFIAYQTRYLTTINMSSDGIKRHDQYKKLLIDFNDGEEIREVSFITGSEISSKFDESELYGNTYETGINISDSRIDRRNQKSISKIIVEEGVVLHGMRIYFENNPTTPETIGFVSKNAPNIMSFAKGEYITKVLAKSGYIWQGSSNGLNYGVYYLEVHTNLRDKPHAWGKNEQPSLEGGERWI